MIELVKREDLLKLWQNHRVGPNAFRLYQAVRECIRGAYQTRNACFIKDILIIHCARIAAEDLEEAQQQLFQAGLINLTLGDGAAKYEFKQLPNVWYTAAMEHAED